MAEPLLPVGMGPSQALQIVLGLAIPAGAVGAYRLSLLSTLVVAALSVVAIQRSATPSWSRSDIEGEQRPSPLFPWSTSLLKRRMK